MDILCSLIHGLFDLIVLKITFINNVNKFT